MGNLLFFFKAMHVVGFVAWFAGLFYLVRMFVYHTESLQREQPARDILVAQFQLMQWRVFRIIAQPAMYITWFFGLGLLYIHGAEWLKANSWMHVKLLLLLLLTLYQWWCKRMILHLESGQNTYSPFQFRLLNELPTIFLVLIAMLAVYRQGINYAYLVGGILGFGLTLFLLAKAYRQWRTMRGE